MLANEIPEVGISDRYEFQVWPIDFPICNHWLPFPSYWLIREFSEALEEGGVIRQKELEFLWHKVEESHVGESPDQENLWWDATQERNTLYWVVKCAASLFQQLAYPEKYKSHFEIQEIQFSMSSLPWASPTVFFKIWGQSGVLPVTYWFFFF